jgi:phosphoglycerate kinase
MKFIEDLDYMGKRVFLRVDFNVPITEMGGIRDDTRIQAALPSITYLLAHKAKLVMASHLGRPKGKIDPKASLKPVAKRLAELISAEVILAPDVVGVEVEALKNGLQAGQVLLLENVRFNPGETANDPGFSAELAKGIDCYVNDAFGSCHRAHASVVGITQFVPETAAGYLLKKEVEYLNKVIRSPKKPFVAILGGAKVSDKIPVIENLLNKADHILIGGAMAYTFFKAQGFGVGKSLVEDDKLETALTILGKAKEKGVNFLLPLDHVLSTAIDKADNVTTVDSFPFPADMMALDIGPKTIAKYAKIISKAKTIFWNGPLGVFEASFYARGTMEIAQAVADSKALSIVGGGDSVAAIYKARVADKISHISTGGGASLEYLAYETLPGIEALEKR